MCCVSEVDIFHRPSAAPSVPAPGASAAAAQLWGRSASSPQLPEGAEAPLSCSPPPPASFGWTPPRPGRPQTCREGKRTHFFGEEQVILRCSFSTGALASVSHKNTQSPAGCEDPTWRKQLDAPGRCSPRPSTLLPWPPQPKKQMRLPFSDHQRRLCPEEKTRPELFTRAARRKSSRCSRMVRCVSWTA